MPDRANDVLERADRLDNAVSNLQAQRAVSPTIGCTTLDGSRGLASEQGAVKNTAMQLLSRWFRRSPAGPSWIEAVALARRREQDRALLILDVRGPDEFTGPLGHIAGATNLPLNDLSERLPELVRKDRPVVVVCKTDRRSSVAADQLRKAGVVDVSVLRGWMERWRELGLPGSETESAALSKTPSAI